MSSTNGWPQKRHVCGGKGITITRTTQIIIYTPFRPYPHILRNAALPVRVLFCFSSLQHSHSFLLENVNPAYLHLSSAGQTLPRTRGPASKTPKQYVNAHSIFICLRVQCIGKRDFAKQTARPAACMENHKPPKGEGKFWTRMIYCYRNSGPLGTDAQRASVQSLSNPIA